MVSLPRCLCVAIQSYTRKQLRAFCNGAHLFHFACFFDQFCYFVSHLHVSLGVFCIACRSACLFVMLMAAGRLFSCLRHAVMQCFVLCSSEKFVGLSHMGYVRGIGGLHFLRACLALQLLCAVLSFVMIVRVHMPQCFWYTMFRR